MKAAKTEALKGLAVGPMALRPFAGEGLVAVGGLPEARGGRRGGGRRGLGQASCPDNPRLGTQRPQARGRGVIPGSDGFLGTRSALHSSPHPGTTRLFIPVQ